MSFLITFFDILDHFYWISNALKSLNIRVMSDASITYPIP